MREMRPHTSAAPSDRRSHGEILAHVLALSRTRRLPDVLAGMVDIICKIANPGKALVLCQKDGEWFIEAALTSSESIARTELHERASSEISSSVFQSALSSLEAGAPEYGPYESGSASVLCYPIRRENPLTAVVYLENGTFDRDHLERLSLLSDFMANAMDNAREVEALKAGFAEHREKEERLRIALEGTSDGIWDWDYATGRAYFSDRYYAMLGYAPGEFPACHESWRKLLHPDDVASAEKALHEAAGKGAAFAIEFRLRSKNGDWRWVLSRGKVAETDADGKPVRIAGSHTDITERKRTEEALSKRLLSLTHPADSAEGIVFEDMFDLDDLQRIQDLFAETCGVAALITRPDGTPITRPSNFCRLCRDIVRRTAKGEANCNHSDAMIGRYNPAGPTISTCLSAGLCNAGASITVGGRHVANWLIGQVRNERHEEEKVVAYAREIGVDESEFRGAYREVPVMPEEQFTRAAHFLFLLANQISGTAYRNIQQARSIMEYGKAEAEIRRLNDELERRVADRTAELEAVNKELEAFAYSVSHDLRAPLRAVRGYARILSEDYGDRMEGEGKRICSIVDSEAGKMELLIGDILRLSRLSLLPMAAMELDMAGMARAVYGETAAEADGRRIDFIVGGMPPALADATLIRQAWANLISNAVKYTSKREKAVIEAGGERRGAENVYWVKDNGAGFDMRYADKLFGVFQRLHSMSEFEGNGIGLAIVQRIVRRHGGRMWAEAKVDKGATFYFSLPAP